MSERPLQSWGWRRRREQSFRKPLLILEREADHICALNRLFSGILNSFHNEVSHGAALDGCHTLEQRVQVWTDACFEPGCG